MTRRTTASLGAAIGTVAVVDSACDWIGLPGEASWYTVASLFAVSFVFWHGAIK